MRNSSFALALRYCRRSKLVFTSFSFQNVPKRELTSLARIMDQNSQKGSQNKAIIHYHLLWKSPFDVLLNSFIIWISDKEASRIIQCHHVTEHAIFKQSKGFLTACRNTAAYCIFLPFGTPDSGSKFRRYQVFIRYYWASAGMTKGNRLSKRKRNVLRRDDYFYVFLFLSNMHYWPSVKSIRLDIYGQIPVFAFC